MSVAKLHTTYTLRSRKGGGYYITVPAADVKYLRLSGVKEARIEVLILRTMTMPVESQSQEETS